MSGINLPPSMANHAWWNNPAPTEEAATRTTGDTAQASAHQDQGHVSSAAQQPASHLPPSRPGQNMGLSSTQTYLTAAQGAQASASASASARPLSQQEINMRGEQLFGHAEHEMKLQKEFKNLENPSISKFHSISGKALYGLHNDGVEAEVSFLGNPPKEVKQMCMFAIKAIGNSFPCNFNKVEFDFYVRETGMDRGHTLSNANKSKISVGLISEIEWEHDFEMHGMIAYTAFHELFLHALTDLRTASTNIESTSEDQDHNIIVSPPNEENPFHKAIKIALSKVPDNLKQYFLDSYVDEVEDEKNMNDSDSDSDSDNPIPTDQWHQEISSHLQNPNSTFWNI